MAGDLATDELDYELPERLIATEPAQPRDSARMLVVHRERDIIEHRQVRDLPEYVAVDDAMVFNTTAVTPARLVGSRADSGGKVHGLFLAQSADGGHWQVMLKSNGRLRPGQLITLHDASDSPSRYCLELLQREGEHWLAAPRGGESWRILDAVGRTPLPPYILRARNGADPGDELDRAWYQTIYASTDLAHQQSVAAPTAGLHFTQDLIASLEEQRVKRLDVLLHVGAGTFKPITAPNLAAHAMHSEQYEVPANTLATLRSMKRTGRGRVFAVGTTTVRTLESLGHPLPAEDAPIAGTTDLLIAPGHTFHLVDALLTNFHLPRSTLLALVGAMTGLERLKAIYAEAIRRDYRFYSYGDAMLVL